MGEFPEPVVQAAWNRAGERCECRRRTHNHPYIRCENKLKKEKRGLREGTDSWEPHHITSQEAGGPDTLSNCEILCWPCHKLTL